MIGAIGATAMAQTWRWGVREGSAYNDFGSYNENASDIATDKQGNIYVIGSFYQDGLNVDGHSETGYGYTDAVISSFTCNGVLRWVKIIGGSNYDYGYNLQLDTLGGVYVTGMMIASAAFSSSTAYVGSDTTIVNVAQQLYLAKFDTAGNYKWFIMPQSDTVYASSYDNTANIDLNVSPNGDVYWMMLLAPGVYANNTFVVDSVSPCILKYNAVGSFQEVIRPQIGVDRPAANDMRMQKDYRSGRFYFAGGLTSFGSLYFDGSHITGSGFVSAFDSTGNLVWYHQSEAGGADLTFYQRPVIDDSGSMYVAGDGFAGCLFNGYTFTLGGGYGAPTVIKLNSGGVNQWVKCADNDGTTGPNGFTAITLNSNNEIVAAGEYGEDLSWPGFADTLRQPLGTLYDIFITRFNKTTGQVLGEDTLTSPPSANEYTELLASDRKGNVYVAGQFESSIYVASDTLVSVGGEYDVFIAKYGYDNCSCTATPTASFTYSPTLYSATFTYTGTTGDSVVWSFGDGTTSTTTNPTHAYAVDVDSSYNVCVTVYTDCGNATTCQDVYVHGESVQTINGANIAVYPNPAKDELVVKGMQESGSYRILNAAGVSMQTGTLQQGDNRLSMQQLSAGMYILEMTGADGARNMVRVVKE